MSRLARIAVPLLISLLLFAGLAWLDTDASTDTPAQEITMFLLITIVVGILYAGLRGFLGELRQLRRRI